MNWPHWRPIKTEVQIGVADKVACLDFDMSDFGAVGHIVRDN